MWHLALAAFAAFAATTNGVVEIAGSADNADFAWHRSNPVDTVPGRLYGLSVTARVIGEGTMAIGTRDAFVERRAPDVSWYDCRHVCRTATGPVAEDRIRVGTAGASGTFSFKDFRWRPLAARYPAFGSLTLGHGESLVGNDYHFSTVFESAARGDSRCLDEVRGCAFRTQFWDLVKGASVTYRHELGGRRLRSGRVEVYAGWGKGGRTFAEVSADGGPWSELGEVKASASTVFDLPASLFPAACVRIRLRCDEGTMFKILQYVFSAKTDGAPVTAYGWTRYADAETGEPFAEVKAPPFSDPLPAGSAGLHIVTEEACVWSAVSAVKVFRTTPQPTERLPTVSLALAANEAESAQIVVSARRGDMSGVRMRVGELRSESGQCLPASAVTVSQVGYVNVRIPSDEAGAAGWWPDPLLPQSSAGCCVRKGENQPFWITVLVPKGTTPGIYRGQMLLEPMGTVIPFEVEVCPFELPDRLTCETTVGFYFSKLAERLGVAEGSPEHEAAIARCLRLFADNRISPFDFGRFLVPDVKGWQGDEPVLDWTRFDHWQRRLVDEFRANTLMVPNTPPELSAARRGRYVAAVQRHLEENGWIDRAYAYVFDEPVNASFSRVAAETRLWKENAPKIRRLVTKEPVEELANGVNLWCPRLDLFKSAWYPKARARGDGLWWYVCCGPHAPYPGEFTDHPGAELRTWLWMTWAEKMQGILLWQSMYWRKGEDPYAETMSWSEGGNAYGNGDGRFIYPPRAGESEPHPSIRLEQLRDGLEDYECFAMLSRRAPNHPLLTVPKAVFTAYDAFSSDPTPLRAHREKVMREITKGQR